MCFIVMKKWVGSFPRCHSFIFVPICKLLTLNWIHKALIIWKVKMSTSLCTNLHMINKMICNKIWIENHFLCKLKKFYEIYLVISINQKDYIFTLFIINYKYVLEIFEIIIILQTFTLSGQWKHSYLSVHVCFDLIQYKQITSPFADVINYDVILQ